MKPRGLQDEAKNELPKSSLEASGRLGAPWVLSWGAPGWSWAPLGALWAALGELLGRSWGLPGRAWGSFGPPGGLRLELVGPLLKAPLRNHENHEIR